MQDVNSGDRKHLGQTYNIKQNSCRIGENISFGGMRIVDANLLWAGDSPLTFFKAWTKYRLSSIYCPNFPSFYQTCFQLQSSIGGFLCQSCGIYSITQRQTFYLSDFDINYWLETFTRSYAFMVLTLPNDSKRKWHDHQLELLNAVLDQVL